MFKFIKNLFQEKPRTYTGWDIGKKGKDNTVYIRAKFVNGKLYITNMR